MKIVNNPVIKGNIILDLLVPIMKEAEIIITINEKQVKDAWTSFIVSINNI